jgi:DNA repair ATPase RecN
MLNVKIKNFQSIGNISFDIDGFTVIVGKNNLGKSAIIRAIDAALTNRTGSEFVRWGKTKAEVSLKKDTLDVNWSKGDTATYKVNGQSFSKLNRSVPQPILDAGIKKMEIGDQKINPLVAHQFEELFLLNEPGSVITDVLSIIYNLNVLSDADELCVKDLKAKKSLLKIRETDHIELKEKLGQYKDLDIIKIEMRNIQELDRKSKELALEIKYIENYITELAELTKETQKLQEMSKITVPSPDKTEKELREYLWFNQALDSLRIVVNRVRELEPASKATIPEYVNVQKFLEQLVEIDIFHVDLEISKNILKKLETASKIVVPDYSAIPGLLQMLIELIQFNRSLESSKVVVERLGAVTGGLELVSILSEFLFSIEEKIKENTIFNALADNFLPSLKMAKNLQIETEKIDSELKNVHEEHSKFNICPLCEKPL